MGAARLYRAGMPFNTVDLPEVDYVQSADVIYFAHLNYPPSKLTRSGHTSWAFAEVTFGPTITAPTGVVATASKPNTDAANNGDNYWLRTAHYAVAAVNEAGQISRLSAHATASNDLSLKGNLNTITWTAHPDAEFYVVFKRDNDGTFGYIGRAEEARFVDGEGGIAPDYADGPRVGENPFAGPGDYPSTVTFHQQRLLWGRTRNKPNGIWGSQAADFENMDRSRPSKPDDALTMGLVSDRVNAVEQLASLRSLLALTSDGIFAINGGQQGDPMTATQIVADRQVGRGASRLNPIVLDSVLFFRPNQGSSVRTLGYTFEVDGYKSNDVAIFSPHFFDGFEIVSWAHQQEPYSAIWAVRSDGKLLCLTWEQEQQVWGWTLCEFAGFVESVAVITERGMDRVYLAIRRTLAGQEQVLIERMALPLLVADDLVDSCYLDCAVTQKYDPPRDVVDQLWHLEGEAVTAFADGYVVEGLTVTGGKVALGFAASTVTVGLPYSGEIETLPLTLMGQQGSAHVSRQMIEEVTVRVEKTRGIKVGASGGELFEVKQREYEGLDQPIDLKTGDYDVRLSAAWSNAATVRVVQDYPLPATINALFLKPRVTK